MHIENIYNDVGFHQNLPFFISLIKESQKMILPDKRKKVLDFGCGNGYFLQLFSYMDNLDYGLGIELNKKLIKQANLNNTNNKIEYKFYQGKYQKQFNIVFSQEVIYTIKNLQSHALEMFSILEEGGYYFATIGSHISNPLWSKRRKIIRQEEQYYAYDYSLDEIAEIFYDVGFRVGLKRLPLEYFMIYDKNITNHFSNTLEELVKTTEENKMLFSFFKPKKGKKNRK
jgi:SAM-dependent methyltransferase